MLADGAFAVRVGHAIITAIPLTPCELCTGYSGGLLPRGAPLRKLVNVDDSQINRVHP